MECHESLTERRRRKAAAVVAQKEQTIPKSSIESRHKDLPALPLEPIRAALREAIRELSNTVSKADTLVSASSDPDTPANPSMIFPFHQYIEEEVHNQAQRC